MSKSLNDKQLKNLEAQESRKRLAEHLMWGWKEWYKVSPINKHAYGIINAATKASPTNLLSQGLDQYDIRNHLQYCAYLIITHQPLTCREIELHSHVNTTIILRIMQVMLFALLLQGIHPLDREDCIVLSRFWIHVLFLAFVAISAWCRYREKWYNEYQRKTATLNAAVTEAEIAAHLRSKEFAESMRKEIETPNCKHKKEISQYLSWYANFGQDDMQIIKSYRIQFTEEEYGRFQDVLPYLYTIIPFSDLVCCNKEEKFILYAINKLAKEMESPSEES